MLQALEVTRAPADKQHLALATELEELLSCDLRALRENFEMEKEEFLAVELRRIGSALAEQQEALLHSLDKLGQTMDQEYTCKVIPPDRTRATGNQPRHTCIFCQGI